MKNLKITTAQIARICGVSQGTVDRALNNRNDIKAQTKQKILEVAREYGYREHISSYTGEIEGLIGVVVFNLNNEYFSELITEIEYALRDEGCSAIVMMSHYNKQYEIECIRNLYNIGVKGIILCSVNSGPEFENYLSLFDIPIVAVGNKIDSVPYVGIDDFKAMREVTENVISSNPSKIVYFSPALNYADAYAQRRRYEGFLSVIGDENYSVVTDIEDIERCDSDTTIIASNDYYALKVYFKGVKAKIVGFDNISVIDKYKIPIDSVSYSMSDIARNAINIINNNTKETIIINHIIIKRENL